MNFAAAKEGISLLVLNVASPFSAPSFESMMYVEVYGQDLMINLMYGLNGFICELSSLQAPLNLSFNFLLNKWLDIFSNGCYNCST